MKLTFLGGADEVGASSALIEIAGKKLLVDAGIRISAKTRNGIENDQLPDLRRVSEAGGPDYILVTHAHTDHTGALPLVVEQYPHVPVLATRPTIELVRVLQADAQRIMKTRQEQEGELPLFDELSVERLMNAFLPVEFHQPVRLSEGLQLTCYPSGHIIGAAMLALESEEGTLVLSGDLSLAPQRTVTSAEVPRLKADALVLESTYGGKLHANRLAEEKRLIEMLRAIVERGGKALIPAFALGRAQEVLQILLTYRDQVKAPVYADGMVRAVCTAYARFADLLPPETVNAAGEDALFFRGEVKPVSNALQRHALAQSAGPAIIVASSGMLTGGPSQFYAGHMAGDARNAILLTGYQDEEAPGRFVQRMVRERKAGQEVAWRLNKETVVPLRCDLDTYSLSAHADEAELLSIAEALGAEHIALVHGDPAARYSIAARLRERQKRALLPVSGGEYELHFERRPWRIGAQHTGSHTQPLDTAALWESLRAEAGSFYSARDLARAWWGDESRAGEIVTALGLDDLYFTREGQRRDLFRVRTPDQVQQAQQRRAIMAAHPNLVGKLVVLRDHTGRARPAVVQSATAEGFEAYVLSTKGRSFPAEALIWEIAPWDSLQETAHMTGRLHACTQLARAVQDKLLPVERRAALIAAGQPVDPQALLPDPLPPTLDPKVDRSVALLAVVLALTSNRSIEVRLEGDRLALRPAERSTALEQNAARQVALGLFPPEARLRKVGMEVGQRRIILAFDFPERAAARFAEQIEQLSEDTGWEVAVAESVNQQALAVALTELLPDGARVVKGPSFHIARREVEATIAGLAAPAHAAELAAAYRELTGFRLLVNIDGQPANGAPGSTPEQDSAPDSTPDSTPDSASDSASDSAPPQGSRMEINAAYALIKQALRPRGLYKAGLKGDRIVLSFISPQVGARCHAEIDRLAQQTGYTLTVHPHPNQQAIALAVTRLARAAGWKVVGRPGLHTDRGEVALTVATLVNAADVTRISAAVEEQTGYKLVIT